MGEPGDPTSSPTRAATPPPDQKTLDANRTEIIVLAIGILFLVSQLILIIWLFTARASARKPREQRIIGWRPIKPNPVPQEAIFSDEHDGRPARRSSYRRSSTWNGRSAATSQDGHPMRRRKSSGLKPADSPTLSMSDPDSDSSDRDSNVVQGFQDAGLAAASLAIPIVPLSPRWMHSPLSSPEPEPESDSSKEHVCEMGSLLATFSPRSPRVGPMNMATISAIVKANERKPSTTPVSPPVTGATELPSFDDPLRVTRRRPRPGNENSVMINQSPQNKDAWFRK